MLWGRSLGCTEALFTLGDKPELKYASVRAELEVLGHANTLSYVKEAAAAVLAQTGVVHSKHAQYRERTPRPCSSSLYLLPTPKAITRAGKACMNNDDAGPVNRREARVHLQGWCRTSTQG